MVAPWWLPRLQDLSICPVTSAKMMSLENALPIGFQNEMIFQSGLTKSFLRLVQICCSAIKMERLKELKRSGFPKRASAK